MAAVVVSALAMLLTLSVAILRGRFRGGSLRGLLCAWAPAAVAAALYLATHFEQFTRRFIVLFAPERDPLNYGFAAIQLRKLLFSLPFVNTSGVMPSVESGQEILLTPDYYLIRLSAGCGWFVLPLAVLLSAVLFWALFRRIRRLHSENGRLLALTAGWVLLLETAGYLLVNTFGSFLLGPISMPFLSYGPTAQLVNFLLLGLLLSIFRMDALVRDPARPLGGVHSGLSIPLPFHKGRIQITYEA